MTAVPFRQVAAEILPSFKAMLADIYATAQKSPAAEKAWRKCLKAGKPPVYHAGYIGMLLIDVEPPEGWHP